MQYRRIDFTYCKGSKFENISQYTAQVWPIDDLPDDYEDATVWNKKVETREATTNLGCTILISLQHSVRSPQTLDPRDPRPSTRNPQA